jgi:hypothetical protein
VRYILSVRNGGLTCRVWFVRYVCSCFWRGPCAPLPLKTPICLLAAERKYQPYLANIASRNDLNYLFEEMLGELTVGHLFIAGGDTPKLSASTPGSSAPTTRSKTATTASRAFTAARTGTPSSKHR